MCVSTAKAIFSKTITGTWEVFVDFKIKHVIWYQNRVGEEEEEEEEERLRLSFENYVRWLLEEEKDARSGLYFLHYGDAQLAVEESKWRKAGGSPRSLRQVMAGEEPAGATEDSSRASGNNDAATGNCLIIPLMGRWESILLLNTADTPAILSDISKALQVQPRAKTLGLGLRGMGAVGRMVFLKFDVYDIVIAERASRIADVIGQIDAQKRPAVDSEVFHVLEDWYRCPVALCCFKKSEAAEAKPVAFAFVPTNPDRLVVYTLDGHDGRPPDPSARVNLDHTIFVGSHRTPKQYAATINYADKIPKHLRPYVLDRAMGMAMMDELINGDIVFDTTAVRKGHFKGERLLPPFAPARSDNGLPVVREYDYESGQKSMV